MSVLNCSGSTQLVIIAALVAIVISIGRDSGDLNVIGNVIAAIGALVLTIAAQEQNAEAKKEEERTKQKIKKRIDYLKNEIQELQERL